jgi:3-isopropylmalate/(R)-2-methylmalate dehydratase small subunit
VLNQQRYRGAQILLTRSNFGCGSSREHAPWALLDMGFRAILAESYADIFFNNCFKNGILPIVVPKPELDALFGLVEHSPGYRLTVDLPQQKVLRPDGHAIPFAVDPHRKECLLNGWDDIGLTLRHADAIREFEARRRHQQPWLFG